MFYRCNFFPRLKHDCFFDFSGKTRTKTRASEAHWRLPSPPVVREKYVICLCELGKCPNPLFYRCKFLERLNHYINFDFSGKTRTKTGDTHPDWRLPSPPIVGEKHVLFLCKLGKCIDLHLGAKLSRIYVKNFQPSPKRVTNFKKLQREHPQLRRTGGSRRRQ